MRELLPTALLAAVAGGWVAVPRSADDKPLPADQPVGQLEVVDHIPHVHHKGPFRSGVPAIRPRLRCTSVMEAT